MLKILVRIAGVAIAALIALVVGVFASAADIDGLPDADHIASIRVDNSPLPRSEIVERLDAFAESTGVGIVRVASAPDDFLNGRVAFRFGSDFDERTNVDWFSPTMSGSIIDSSELGATSLNGVYAIYGSDADAATFQRWAQSKLTAEVVVNAKSPAALLSYVLLTVGAWVPVTAALLLLGATILSWYVLRARARELSMLAGMRLSMIVLTDLRSLLAALALPAITTFGVSVIIALIAGFGRIGYFVATLGTFSAVVGGTAIVLALIMAVLTLPDVRQIAARKPPERSSWLLSEMFKATAVILVAAISPGTLGLVAAAAAASELGSTWASMGDSVTVRIGSAELGDIQNNAFGGLVRDSAKDDAVLFSMSLSSTNSVNLVDAVGTSELAALGFDSVVLADRRYLDSIQTAGTVSVADSDTIKNIEDLPPTIARLLLPTIQLWTLSGDVPDLHFYRSAGASRFPVFGGMAGTFETHSEPLILGVDGLDQFNDPFLTSALSQGNLVFTDASQVAASVETRQMSAEVLSVDRVADLGLYDAQSKQRNAQLGLVAVALALLALIMCVTVTAWIFSLLRRRRWFVQHTAGRSWNAILLPRMVWEAVVAITFGAALSTALAALSPAMMWIGGVAPLGYLVLSWGIHLWAATTTFRSTLSRRG
ncbi:hypothetical protein [Salinibacterium sp.]|uniref:hypothetical protein n=1 Tax=Salinibacterium sp. TaxID=1915057 RepID=UPI00286C7659|nr:hypothetical protein [Salinibacterium sp.]